jgi:hypothetical protein
MLKCIAQGISDEGRRLMVEQEVRIYPYRRVVLAAFMLGSPVMSFSDTSWQEAGGSQANSLAENAFGQI